MTQPEPKLLTRVERPERTKALRHALTVVALVLGIIIQAAFIWAMISLAVKFQEIQEALQGPADPPVSELPFEMPIDPPSLNEGDVEGTYEVCDVSPDGEPFCEEITE